MDAHTGKQQMLGKGGGGSRRGGGSVRKGGNKPGNTDGKRVAGGEWGDISKGQTVKVEGPRAENKGNKPSGLRGSRPGGEEGRESGGDTAGRHTQSKAAQSAYPNKGKGTEREGEATGRETGRGGKGSGGEQGAWGRSRVEHWGEPGRGAQDTNQVQGRGGADIVSGQNREGEATRKKGERGGGEHALVGGKEA